SDTWIRATGRPGGRLAVLLHAPVGGDHLQLDGHLPAASGAHAEGGQQERSAASLPRPFSSGIQLYSLGRLRDRHSGLRLGGRDRIRNRPEFALWTTFGMGGVPNSLRRVGRPLPSK